MEFIRKLADYEKRLDEVIATEEDIRKWVFEKHQVEVIFALEDVEPPHPKRMSIPEFLNLVETIFKIPELLGKCYIIDL